MDSAYVQTNTETYNLLMKVDTNTKGNTYWFMFKVKNFRVGKKYTFNILNFTRNMDCFYRHRMNIITRAEKIPDFRSEVGSSVDQSVVSSKDGMSGKTS